MKIKNLFYRTLMGIAILSIASCSQDSFENDTLQDHGVQEPTEFIYTMHWDAPSPDFDGKATRAVTKSWDNGSVLYLRFKNGSQWIAGYATYNLSSDSWTISASSSVPTTSSNTECELYYFQNPDKVGTDVITLSAYTATFKCTGSYIHPTASEFYVTGTLEPVVWRLRFQGSSSTVVNMPESDNDILYYTSFNRSTGALGSPVRKTISLSVSNGYTPYIYGTFVNPSGNNNMRLEVSTTQDGYYTRTIQGSKLAVGTSGVMTIPTQSNYDDLEWKCIKQVTNCDVNVVNPCLFTDGIVMEFEIGSNAKYFYYNRFEKAEAEAMSDEDLISSLLSEKGFPEEEFEYTYRSTRADANTNYYLCAVATNANGDPGKLLRYPFKTKSTNLPIAKLSNLKATTYDGDNVWTFDIAMENGCKSYYLISLEDDESYGGDEHWNAYYMYCVIVSGELTSTYTWSNVRAGREGSNVMVYTWALDAQKNIGNYNCLQGSTSTSVKPVVSKSTEKDPKRNCNIPRRSFVEHPVKVIYSMGY